jgi:hypothetical protein
MSLLILFLRFFFIIPFNQLNGIHLYKTYVNIILHSNPNPVNNPADDVSWSSACEVTAKE